MASAMGLIRITPNSDMVKAEREAAEATEAAREINLRPQLQGIAAHVTECWNEARKAKQNVRWRLERAQRALIGEYDPDKLRHIRSFGGSEEYARVTANKIRVVESWLRDVYMGQSGKPWSLKPTPKVDFPPDAEEQVRQRVSMMAAQQFAQTGEMPDPVAIRGILSSEMDQFEEQLQEEARRTTERMERKMQDQLTEAGFETELSRFLIDLATYPTAIMKGPVLRRRKRLAWIDVDGSGRLEPQVETEIVPDFERVDPFRVYPAPGAVSPQEGYFFEHHTLTRKSLYEMIGVPGYDEEAIRAVLREGEYGGLAEWLTGTDRASDIQLVSEAEKRQVFEFDALEYHGPIKGKDLMDWGIDDEELADPEATYEACVWMIGRWVIKAQLNYDPLGQRPYYSASYEHVPGEFWGQGLPDILDDVQGIVNAAVRALNNNMGMASGPMVGINIDRLAPGQDITTLTPWQIFQMQDDPFGSNTSRPLEFFQPDSNVTELMSVIEKFYQFADDFSLVPRYMAGSDKVGGAGRTASGLSMLMDAANKGLKGVVSNVDRHIFSPMLQKLYNHNMLYASDPTIKGDAQVVAEGAVSLMRLESLQLRRNEFLNVTNNPSDLAITGLEGRAEVLRSAVDGLELNSERIVPPADQMAQRMQQMQATAAAGQPSPATSQETLPTGGAVTDNFSPNSMTPSG
jgi:hypothetical protein